MIEALAPRTANLRGTRDLLPPKPVSGALGMPKLGIETA